jgi:hypothetical protein
LKPAERLLRSLSPEYVWGFPRIDHPLPSAGLRNLFEREFFTDFFEARVSSGLHHSAFIGLF